MSRSGPLHHDIPIANDGSLVVRSRPLVGSRDKTSPSKTRRKDGPFPLFKSTCFSVRVTDNRDRNMAVLTVGNSVPEW